LSSAERLSQVERKGCRDPDSCVSRALAGAPDSDHAHYIMSVALTARGDSTQAVDHLRQAITLNPENRALARQDPDLEPLRFTDEFRDLVDAPDAARSRGRKRR
jgi:tetratricopeptide (TPR) repeat protein